MSGNTLPFVLVLLLTFLVSTITLLTGFGVGTVLTPTFALFYEVKTAVLLVSFVHLANNILKFFLFRTYIDKTVFRRFGIVSVVGALAGSVLQGSLDAEVVAWFLAFFLIISGLTEIVPAKYSIKISKNYDIAGGFFSGLMGGLIGNQGAIRSAYLLNYDLSKEAFIGTATVIAILIDLTRIPVYLIQESEKLHEAAGSLLIVTLCAFAGTMVGRRLLKKIPLEKFRLIIALFIITVGVKLLIW